MFLTDHRELIRFEQRHGSYTNVPNKTKRMESTTEESLPKRLDFIGGTGNERKGKGTE